MMKDMTDMNNETINQEGDAMMKEKNESGSNAMQQVDNDGAIFIDVATIQQRDEFRCRIKEDKETIERYTDTFEGYREALERGEKPRYPFPAIKVWDDNGQYVLLGGYHRTAAARAAGQSKIKAIVFHGTADEAFMVAYRDNNTHGLNLSSGDKKYSIVKALLRFPDKTLRILGKELGCTYSYISVIRKEMVANGELVEPDKRMGRDGIMRSTKRNNSTKPPNGFGANEHPEQDDTDGKAYGSLVNGWSTLWHFFTLW